MGHLYFGLSGLDNSAFDRFDPGENRGDVIFEDAFSLEEAEAQASFLGFCDTLETADCGLEARPRTPRTHMRRTCMVGWMDGWMDGWMHAWMGTCMHEHMHAYRLARGHRTRSSTSCVASSATLLTA